ncbi:unnamed protein product [Echinostoma caproni]|uniref:CUB domain-containing protein n=1 Tax=Echinostoma caproni TaxID=27848 RepID=A0A182ZZI7_9TREM|nr:unnamed protein product [Echinostoma caproni]
MASEANVATSKGYVTITRDKPTEDPPGSAKALQKIQLIYKLVDDAQCSEVASAPTETQQYFQILKDSNFVAENAVACRWTLTAIQGKSIRVSLDVNSPIADKQCITVSNAVTEGDPEPQTICGTTGKNIFTSAVGKGVNIEYESPIVDGKPSNTNFKVTYQLVSTAEVNDPRCADAPQPPKSEVQSFPIAKSGTTIPADLRCMWNIESTESKNIRVSLKVITRVAICNDDVELGLRAMSLHVCAPH